MSMNRKYNNSYQLDQRIYLLTQKMKKREKSGKCEETRLCLLFLFHFLHSNVSPICSQIEKQVKHDLEDEVDEDRYEEEDDFERKKNERPVGEPLHLEVPLLPPLAPPEKVD